MTSAPNQRLVGPISLTSTDTLVYTVPAGFKAIVKALIGAIDPAHSQSNIPVSIGPFSGGGMLAQLFPAQNSPPIATTYVVEADVPLSAGETLYAHYDSGHDPGYLTVVGELIPV